MSGNEKIDFADYYGRYKELLKLHEMHYYNPDPTERMKFRSEMNQLWSLLTPKQQEDSRLYALKLSWDNESPSEDI